MAVAAKGAIARRETRGFRVFGAVRSFLYKLNGWDDAPPDALSVQDQDQAHRILKY